ncbi:MAG: DUF4474 domain-containing protein [Clostridia bacterium]|nr:DUF4474 domain-containing protein [Clostridia bacterium]
MKKLYKLILCAFMCMSIIFTCSALISAASKVQKVQNVTVSSVAANKVTLKWKKLSGISGYRVYRYSTNKKKYVYVGKTKKTTYTVSSLYAGKAYKFKVRAYKTKNDKNTYGAYSDTVKGATAPKKVKGLKTTYLGTSNAELSWKKAKGASGYEIFFYDYKKKHYVSVGTTAKTKITVKNLTSNTKYKVKVAAFHKKNGKVYGLKSDSLIFRTILPEIHSISLSKVTKSSYTLNWSAVKGADGYMVYRYNDGWKKVLTTDSKSYTVKNLKPGTAHVYRVRAYKKNGSSYNYGGYSKQITANTIPEAPTGLSLSVVNGAVQLTWKTNGKATGYEISRFNNDRNTWEVIGKTAYDTYTDDKLIKTGNYSYRVRAYVGEDAKYTTPYTATATIFFESSHISESIYGDSVMSQAGVLGFLLDPNEGCFYTSSDPWQRRIGYNAGFDMGASLVTIYIDTVRVKFEYKDKDWMLQFWKGQYGPFFYGAEIGLYNKPKNRDLDHYDCVNDDESILMSMDFYRDGVHKFSRPLNYYWWCTGFVPYSPLVLVPAGTFMTSQARKALRVESRIVPTDADMFDAIVAALESEKVKEEGLDFNCIGDSIYVTYQ